MELRHLQYFLMLSKELHFTKAAEKLGISQPTLSHQIKLLEKEIGYPLFNRVGKKIDLTTAGEIVQQEANNIQASIDNIHNRLVAVSNLEIGELKIAVLPGELTDLVSTICIAFNKLYPNIKIFIETTDQIEQSLLHKRADFAIGFQFQPKEALQITKLYEEEFYVIRQTTPRTKSVTFADVVQQPLILFPSTQQCRKLLDKASMEQGLTLTPIVETSSISSVLNLVRSGIGQSIVSRTLYEFYDTHDLHYQTIQEPNLNRDVYLMTKKDCFINYAARAYIQLLLREIEKLQFDIEHDVYSIFE